MRNISTPPPQFCIAIIAAFMLASCGGGGSSGASNSGTGPVQQVFSGLNDSRDNSTDESVEIDIFDNGSLLVTVHITENGFAISEYFASFSGSIPNIHTFIDNEDDWTGNIALASPADSNLFPDISQIPAVTNITRSDDAIYRGMAGGAADNVEISDPNFTQADADALFQRNAVYITATDIGFSDNGALTGAPEFTIDSRTVGTGEPLVSQTATLEGSFRGPAGEIIILSGNVTNSGDTLFWGSISGEVQ